MLIEDFELMDDAEKEEAIWEHGIFLVNYDEDDHMCDVYELFDFYVAFCYELQKNLKAKITSSINPDELPHLLKLNKLL